VKPLTDLTKHRGVSNKITLNHKQQTAFDVLKCKLQQAPVLHTPDYNLSFILQTDASDFAIGALLAQNFEGNEHPIAFASAKFTDTQKKWSTIEREACSYLFS